MSKWKIGRMNAWYAMQRMPTKAVSQQRHFARLDPGCPSAEPYPANHAPYDAIMLCWLGLCF